ncbi:MAG: MotA/TolQ/ExbB proton channel family protein [Kofleriaceae bacterium]|nr:MotA/TolQ/ExbB proton channel family protein [Kofleriaceae bacterium]
MDLTDFFLRFALLGAEWVLWLLVVLSIGSIAVMIDRGVWFRQRDADTEAFRRELRGAFERGELAHLVKKHQDSPSVAVQVALRGLEHEARGAEAVAEAMHGERARWRRAGERNLIILGTLGNNVPFIGLFGTVLGVIKAFDDLKAKTAESEAQVMAGIAEALVATAIGLLVAVPAVIAFNYFNRRLKVALTGADECAHAVLAEIHGRAATTTTATATATAAKPAGAA